MPILRYNTYHYAYHRYGDRHSPAIVLVMGLAMSSALWPDLFIQGLVDNGFQVITLDNRDSGDSSYFTETEPTAGDVLKAIALSALHKPVKSPYALEDMAFDVERILDYLEIRRAHVLGLSMGGMIAQTMAMQCPNRVASLISMSSASGHFLTGIGNPFVISSLLFNEDRVKQGQARIEYFRSYFRRLAGKTYAPSDQELDAVIEKIKDMPYDRHAQRRQLLAIFSSGDRRQNLRQIRVPSLVIHGSSDPLLPVKAGRECHQLIKDSQYVEIKGMGHIMTNALIPRLVQCVSDFCYQQVA